MRTIQITINYLLQACAKEGAQVIATDINAEKLAELQGTEGVCYL